MLVIVYLEGDMIRQPAYVNVQGVTDKDEARKIAFRFVHKRREKDYNELVHACSTPEVKEISSETGQTMLSHLN